MLSISRAGQFLLEQGEITCIKRLAALVRHHIPVEHTVKANTFSESKTRNLVGCFSQNVGGCRA